MKKIPALLVLPAAVLALLSAAGNGRPSSGAAASEFRSAWPRGVERTWIGPEYWANRLQDWRIRGGRLECLTTASDRNVHILTRRVAPAGGDFEMRVRTALVAPGPAESRERVWVGFRAGARGEFSDYRDSAVYGKGLDCGLSAGGDLFIGDFEVLLREDVRLALRDRLALGVELRLASRAAEGRAALTLAAFDPDSGAALASIERAGIEPAALAGNLALVASLSGREVPESGAPAWFADWTISGPAVETHDECEFGPILFAMHTVSRGTMKMTAQLPPVGPDDGKTVKLKIQKADGEWMEVGEAPVDPDARTATFRVPGWDTTRDVDYVLTYDLATGDEARTPHPYDGTVRREPAEKAEFVLAAFTGNNDVGFPHAEVAAHVLAHDPDLLFFSGDQIYERVGGYGVEYEPEETAILEYLRKWYLFGWAFGELLRERPAVVIPDDHDVFHGNLWGAGGKAASPGWGMEAQDSGGYKMPARWVNMVQRTQTGHLPDPYDPAPAEQGIGVYYCDLRWAGLSFAVLEDRKFKSAPKPLLPEARVRNGWARNPEFRPDKEGDPPGAELLGKRQLGFLRAWAADWTGGAWMKVVLSQTLFADVFTLPEGARGDDGVPQLPIFKPDEYPPDDRPVADMDSNGWPVSGRNAALREMRKAFALHVAGDQHLGSTIIYGVDAWRDSGYALCVPSISNLWPRRWFPKTPGLRRAPGDPPYTGDFKDGFGNRMTVLAAANPRRTGRVPAEVYDRATGYGIARFDRGSRRITLEAWPRWEDPKAGGKPYPGWPITLNQLDNYGRAAQAWLPTLRFKGLPNPPVVQVLDGRTGEIVYTVRAASSIFRPKVFAPGFYTVKAGEPGTEMWTTVGRLAAGPAAVKAERTVEFKAPRP